MKTKSNKKNNTGSFTVYLPYLISFYLVLRLYAANPLEVAFKELIILFLVFQFTALVVHFACKIIIKDWMRASLIAVTVLFFHATYGVARFLVWGIGIPLLTRFVVFLLTVILTAALIYIIVKMKNLQKLISFAKVFIIVLIFFSALNLVKNLNSHVDKTGSESLNSPGNMSHADFASEFKRDIYYMLFDTYMGHRQLKQYYGFDNSEFIEALRTRGFYVVENSRSNYSTTYVSMPATLNMEYMPHSPMFRKELMNLLWNNRTLKMFSDMGFRTNTISLGVYFPSFANADYQFRTIFTQFTEETIMQTYAGELIKRLVYQKNGAKRTPKSFDILYDIARDEAHTFTYSHMMIPHAPYYFTPDGKLYENVDLDWLPQTDDGRFIDQYKYLNKQIIALVDTLLESDLPPVIILQGDHGKSAETETPASDREIYDQELSILNAFYFPDGDYSLLYENITSVNTFPLFKKKYVDPNVELNEDVSYKIKLVDKYNYHIIDVSEYGFNDLPDSVSEFDDVMTTEQ